MYINVKIIQCPREKQILLYCHLIFGWKILFIGFIFPVIYKQRRDTMDDHRMYMCTVYLKHPHLTATLYTVTADSNT